MSRTDQATQQIASYVQQGDESMASGKFENARSSYSSAYEAANAAYGFLGVELLPILEKLIEATYQANNQDWYKKQLVGHLRTILAIKQRQHGIASAELLPVLTQLVIFYDYDGAHMLAIEVKQRIDDIKAELASA